MDVARQNLRERLIGPCVQPGGEDNVAVDVESFVHRLLLFESYVLQSAAMLEFPQLVEVFGLHGLETLLQTRVLTVQCDAVAMGQTGQAAALRGDKPVLPPGSFSLSIIRAHDQQDVVQRGLSNVQVTRGSLKEIIRLKRAIVDSLEQPPPGFGVEALRGVPGDLQNGALLAAAVARGVRETLQISVPENKINARAVQLDSDDFRIESNVASLVSVDDATVHAILERAALAIGDISFVLERMKAHNALCGALEDEANFFEYRLGVIAHEVDPTASEKQFGRIIEVCNFPSVSAATTRIDVDALLRVRESSECREFRRWVASTEALSDEEIAERVAGLNARVNSCLQSTPGKVVRFLSTTAVGLVPDYGLALGMVAGVLDTFLVERLFPVSGPALFLNHTYPSIFRKS